MTGTKRLIITGLIPLLALVAGCGSSTGTTSTSQKTYTIYLSNSYLGEGYRTQMQNAGLAAIKRAPMKGRVNLHIVLSDANTAASQIASIQNMILQKPDAIVIDPSNGPAMIPVIQRACAAGIKVVVFDSAVDATCNTSLQPDWSALGEAQGDWLGKTLNGKGKVALDAGLAGVPLSADLINGVKKSLAKYPDIQIVATFESQFAPGPEQTGVASAMASNPDLAGVVVDGAGAGAFNAFASAGKVLPIAAFSYNGFLLKCAQVAGAQCYAGSAPNYQSAQAIYNAFQELDTGAKLPTLSIIKGACYQNNGISPAGLTCDKIVLEKNTFAAEPFDLTLPVSPPWANPPFDTAEVTTAPK